ncbi:hypothetical protein [Dictyobacter arantiisoli]|uniref:hypothetical protein n=1 Tax=Dictyobacter arantiisoli TaxID=2014874 RepID=UPI0011F02AC9|nr:hypothetical protein [Dictyobacter arantiisoli]
MRTLSTVHKSGFFTDADGRLRLFWRVFLYTLAQALIYAFIHMGLQPLLYNKLHVMDIITFLVDGVLHLALILLTTSLFWRYVDS